MPLEEKYLRLIGELVPRCRNLIVADRLSLLYDRIIQTNERLNITSLTSPIDVTLKHFADSLSLFALPDFEEGIQNGKSVCDIGCGGGFPGLPIACAIPTASITMIDSTEKKIKALGENARCLGLSKVFPLTGRGEELARCGGAYREKFDFVVSRAVADLPILCELCLPFVKIGGSFIALKGQRAPDELERSKKAISMLGGRLREAKELCLTDQEVDLSEFDETEKEKVREFLSARRYLIVIEKMKKNVDIYPRKWAQMTKKPL